VRVQLSAAGVMTSWRTHNRCQKRYFSSSIQAASLFFIYYNVTWNSAGVQLKTLDPWSRETFTYIVVQACVCVCVLWVLCCVLVVAICVLVFTVFCIVCTVFFVLFRVCICFLIVLSVLSPSDNSISVNNNNNNNNNTPPHPDVSSFIFLLYIWCVGLYIRCSFFVI
jgi:hypothetical protein